MTQKFTDHTALLKPFDNSSLLTQMANTLHNQNLCLSFVFHLSSLLHSGTYFRYSETPGFQSVRFPLPEIAPVFPNFISPDPYSMPMKNRRPQEVTITTRAFLENKIMSTAELHQAAAHCRAVTLNFSDHLAKAKVLLRRKHLGKILSKFSGVSNTPAVQT